MITYKTYQKGDKMKNEGEKLVTLTTKEAKEIKQLLVDALTGEECFYDNQDVGENCFHCRVCEMIGLLAGRIPDLSFAPKRGNHEV